MLKYDTLIIFYSNINLFRPCHEFFYTYTSPILLQKISGRLVSLFAYLKSGLIVWEPDKMQDRTRTINTKLRT